jgi:hypothetical protein
MGLPGAPLKATSWQLAPFMTSRFTCGILNCEALSRLFLKDMFDTMWSRKGICLVSCTIREPDERLKGAFQTLEHDGSGQVTKCKSAFI